MVWSGAKGTTRCTSSRVVRPSRTCSREYSCISFMARERANFIAIAAFADGGADGFVHRQHFVNADAAFEAGEIADFAAVGRVMERRRVRDSGEHQLRSIFRRGGYGFGTNAEAADQALRDDGGERSGDLKSGHAQVEQAGDGGDAVVGM